MRNSNFDIVRLLAATTVLLTHFGVWKGSLFWNAEIAVYCFFCISGFLITQSYLRSRTLGAYLKKRAARVYPPIVVVVMALTTAGAINHAGVDYFRGVFSLLFFQDWICLSPPPPQLRLFTEVSLQTTYAHGAFWTLVIEAQFYISLPPIIWMLRRHEKVSWALMMIMYVASHYFCSLIAWDQQAALAYRLNILNYIRFFIPSILLGYYWPNFSYKKSGGISAVVVIILFVLTIFPLDSYSGFLNLVWGHFHGIVLPVAMMFLALGLARIFGVFGRTLHFGDLSYGIYLYHFPVATILTQFGLKYSSVNVWLTLVFTLLVSYLSWHFVEKLWIDKSHAVS